MKCACILAAGIGSRLKKYTRDRTKCMVEVSGNQLINHTINSLLAGGVQTIFIVIGYCGDDLVQHVTETFPNLDVRYIKNNDYETTNNIFSLKLALPELIDFDEIILVESDLWIESSVAVKFIRDIRDNVVLASPFRYWMDGTCVTIDSMTQAITGFVAKSDIHTFINNPLYKTVNWYKFSGVFLQNIYSHFIEAYVDAFGKNAYYEDVLKVIASVSPGLFHAHIIQEQEWMEIDDEEDLSRAELISSTGEQAIVELIQRFGGYWKFPYIVDLTLLVNPFFPTQGMIHEMEKILGNALRGYPSKLSVIDRIAAKSVNCESEHIVVGNGASELMNVLFTETQSREYVISPPFFLEYQRLLGSRLEVFRRNFPETPLSSVLMEMVERSGRDILLINPNNPTGELCEKELLISVLKTLNEQGRRLIVDESFMDFSDGNESLLRTEIINEYSNLIIIKSFGKSFGVPGVRLGILVSSDQDILSGIRRSLPIWNISSSAEVFLDLLPRYKTEYKNSLKELRTERDVFQKSLENLGIEYFSSKGNFVFFKVQEKADKTLDEHFFQKGMLVKKITDREGLNGVYYRIAVRTRTENQEVIEALSEYIR